MAVGFPLLAIALAVLVYWVAFRIPVASTRRSLSSCGECGRVVDSDASVCRHCGAAFY